MFFGVEIWRLVFFLNLKKAIFFWKIKKTLIGESWQLARLDDEFFATSYVHKIAEENHLNQRKRILSQQLVCMK